MRKVSDTMGLDIVVSVLGHKVLENAPGWLARWLAPVEKVAGQVNIDLWRERPVAITFGSAVPMVEINFCIVNNSHVDLILDRLLIEFWASQPLFNAQVLDRFDLRKRTDNHRVYLRHYLGFYDGQELQRFGSNNPIADPVTLEVSAYFSSRTDSFKIHKQLKQTNVPITGSLRTVAS